VDLRVEGVVRVMHPDKGMGVEFTQATAQHREGLEKFFGVLTANKGLLPELLVEPEGLETEGEEGLQTTTASTEDDPLLGLFRIQSALPVESFQQELRKQRGLAATAGAGV
jgi:hypothetical protein